MSIPPPSEAHVPGTLQIQGERLALAKISAGSRIERHGEVFYLDMNGADITKLNTRAPFLLEHRATLDDLLGDVKEAWIEGDSAFAIVRFCDLPAANTVWSLLQQDFPIGCSLGFHIRDCKPVEGTTEPTYRVSGWEAFEVSAAVIVDGADHLTWIKQKPPSELVKMIEERREARLELEHQRKLQALRADDWLSWSLNGAADHIGNAVNVDPGKIRKPLHDEVLRHLRELGGL